MAHYYLRSRSLSLAHRLKLFFKNTVAHDYLPSRTAGNPPATGYTTIAQKNMDYMIHAGPGRTAFVRYWTLMAEAITEEKFHEMIKQLDKDGDGSVTKVSRRPR